MVGFGSTSKNSQSTPIGVKIVSIFILIGAVVGLIRGVLLVAMGQLPLGGIYLIGSVIQPIIAFGLWNLKKWGWICSLLLYGCFGVVNLILGASAQVLGPIIISIYLVFRKEIFL